MKLWKTPQVKRLLEHVGFLIYRVFLMLYLYVYFLSFFLFFVFIFIVRSDKMIYIYLLSDLNWWPLAADLLT